MENTRVGPFLIIKRLGKNRRQEVFHARQTEQDRDVALKFIQWPEKIALEQALEKVQREVDRLKQLRHENLARTFGAGVHEERIFFASEMIKGESLASILMRRGRLATDLVVEYGGQIAEILRYVHSEKQVLGRLTPEKLMVTSDHKIKLIDPRVSRANRRRWDAPKRPQPEVAAYLAPEQFTEGPSERADFYSLGVILFEMTSGQLPVDPDNLGRMIRQKQDSAAPSVAERVMDCPVWLDKMIAQLLEPRPKDRPYSATAIVLAFDEIKKLDSTQKSAAAHIAGSFNPLNAGRDKSEAKRVLGKKVSSQQEPHEPFYQTIPFLVGALMLTAAVAIWFALPPNAGDLVDRSRTLVESSNAADWKTATESMKRVMESKSKFASQAEEIYLQAQRKTLLDLAQRGMKSRNFHSPETRTFVDAYALELDEKTEQAKSLYVELVRTVEPEGDKAHIYLEARDRFKKLAGKIKLPETEEMLLMLVEQAKQARTERELTFARRVLTRIYVLKSGEPEFENVVEAAKETLDSVQQKLKLLADANAESPPTDSITPESESNQNADAVGLETEQSDGVDGIPPGADQQ